MNRIMISFVLLLTVGLCACSSSQNDPLVAPTTDSLTTTEGSQTALESTTESEAINQEAEKTDSIQIITDGIVEVEAVYLPEMKPEYQLIYDQNIGPFVFGDSFMGDFDKDGATIFNAAFIYSCILKPREFMTVPQDIVEEEVAKYFPVTPEQMRELSRIYEYDASKEVYDVPPYGFQSSLRGVIIDCKESDGQITVVCDWYTTASTYTLPDKYSLYATAEMTIEASTGAFISNKVTER